MNLEPPARNAAYRRVRVSVMSTACAAAGTEITQLHSYENTSTVGFPPAFAQYVNACWRALTEERQRLVQAVGSTLVLDAPAGKRGLSWLWQCCERRQSAANVDAKPGTYARLVSNDGSELLA